MRRDDPRDHAALSRHWDGIVGGDPAPAADPPPDLAATIDALHRLDRAPDPRPTFVDHLEKELMGTATPTATLPLSCVVSSDAVSLNGHGGGLSHTRPLDRLLPRRHLAGLAAAAVVLLAVVSGIIVYRLAPSNGEDDPNRVALNAPATPDTDLPGPEECQIAPAPLERLALEGTPSVEAAVPLVLDSNGEYIDISVDDLPSGEAVDAETLAAIAATIREFAACSAANDPARASALFTDDYWRRLHQRGMTPDPARLYSFAPLGYWLTPNEPPSLPSVENARLLDDGRIGAAVQPNLFFVFKLVEDRWRIDEFVAFTRTSEESLLPTHELPPGAVALEGSVTLDDIVYKPDSLTIAADTPVTIHLRNRGYAVHDFTIDALNIHEVLDPGESTDITINAPAGDYEYICTQPGHYEAGMAGTLFVVEFGTSE